MDDPYWIMVLADETPGVGDVVEGCLELGLTTTQDGRTDVCEEYRITGAADDADADDSLDAVVERLSGAESGSISFWMDGYARLSVWLSHEEGYDWNEPKAFISVETKPLDPGNELHPEQSTREKIQRRVDTIVDLTGTLAERADPEFVYGHLRRGPDPTAGLKPTGRPIGEHVDGFSWITVLSGETVAELGGREHVLDAPAWHVEELETGHVMLVKSNHPFDPTEAPPGSVDEHLLGAGRGKRPREPAGGVSDPFRHLEDGTMGADVVVRRDDVEGDLTNDDLELVRCEVDDDALWELDDGSFLRRTIDPQGNTVGELPDGVAPEDEPYPPLVRLDVPPAFVRLDSPTDETIVTKVMAMDTDVSKVDVLANLAAAVADEDDLEAIEPLVDQLHDLDDVDGIDRLIEDRIL